MGFSNSVARRFGLSGVRHRPIRARSKRLTTAVCLALLAALATSCGESTGSHDGAPAARLEGPAASGFAGAALPIGAAGDFTLRDIGGHAVSTRAYRGSVVAIAFLDSSCGAPCEVIAQQLRGALDTLSSPIPTLLVSVDPARDTRASVARLLASTSLRGRALYLDGPATALARVWRAYRVPGPVTSAAGFDRFAPVVLLDRLGRARVAYSLETLTPESLAHDVRALQR